MESQCTYNLVNYSMPFLKSDNILQTILHSNEHISYTLLLAEVSHAQHPLEKQSWEQGSLFQKYRELVEKVVFHIFPFLRRSRWLQ